MATLRSWCPWVLVLQLTLLETACGAAAPAAPAVEPPRQAVHAPDAAAPAGALQHEVLADDGHPLAVWEKRPVSQPHGSILLVHGRTWSSLPDFDLQVPGEQRSTMDGLVDAGIAAYALDLRGYGATPRDGSGWTTPEQAASDVTQVLSWIDERDDVAARPALLGWSLGSLTAQLVAQRHPEMVSDLILYGYPRSFDHHYAKSPRAEASPPATPTTKAAAISDFITPGSISAQAIEAFAAQALRSDPIKADWRQTEVWNELDPARIQTPVLLLHGEHDPYAPVPRQAALFSRIASPDRTWVIVAGGDHAAHLEDTRGRWLHAVITFLHRPRNPKRSERDNQQ